MTVGEAIDRYISEKSKVLSPYHKKVAEKEKRKRLDELFKQIEAETRN